MTVMVHKNKTDIKKNSGHKQDFYPTPLCLVYELDKLNIIDKNARILDPCCGTHAIDDTLNKLGYNCKGKGKGKDIIYGQDFLKSKYKKDKYDVICMNPPFDLFDDFVLKAKEVAPIIISIGKTDLFSAYQRYQSGFWNNLKDLYIFDRKVDYSNTELSMSFKCGMMTTGWFIWDKSWNKDYFKTHIIDVQKYTKNNWLKDET